MLVRSKRNHRTRAVARPRRHLPGLLLGPQDEGRVLTERQYLRCIDAPGYVSEIFDGVLHVSPVPLPTHDSWQTAIYDLLSDLARRQPGVINKVTHDNDVVIAGRPGVTRPRPDVSAYRNFPRLEELARRDDWSFYCPIVVVQIISKRRRRKDIERNRVLYWAAGGIAEYWIIDPSRDPRRPTLTVLTREAGRTTWIERKVAFGETSAALGGLEINLRALAVRK